jgi:hypothetical protein
MKDEQSNLNLMRVELIERMKAANKRKLEVVEVNSKIQEELEGFVRADENVEKELKIRNNQCLNNQKIIL